MNRLPCDWYLSFHRCVFRWVLCSFVVSVLGCSSDTDLADQTTDDGAGTVASSTASPASTGVQTTRRNRRSKYLRNLSEYKLFQGKLANLDTAAGVVAYDVNTPLFADYAAKHRVVRVPQGTSATYRAASVFDFPVGTVIAKTFYYDHDMRDPQAGRQLVETRILIHQPGGWIGLPYVWNSEQSDATLSLVGGRVDVAWIHADGSSRTNNHLVPNFNDCKRCHENTQMEPIGPRAGSLNRDFPYAHGTENQLDHWTRIGLLAGAPKAAVDAPRLAVWNDPTSGTLDARARAWLEVNCAHCHSPTGPARNSGLHLHADVNNPYRLGVFKTPVAAGRGTGGRLYDIVPGKPDDSIMMYRLQTDHVGEMMPEFGRSLVDVQAVALIRQWIEQMPTPAQASVSKQSRN